MQDRAGVCVTTCRVNSDRGVHAHDWRADVREALSTKTSRFPSVTWRSVQTRSQRGSDFGREVDGHSARSKSDQEHAKHDGHHDRHPARVPGLAESPRRSEAAPRPCPDTPSGTEARAAEPSPDLAPSMAAPVDAFQSIEARFARGEIGLDVYEAARKRRGLD